MIHAVEDKTKTEQARLGVPVHMNIDSVGILTVRYPRLGTSSVSPIHAHETLLAIFYV